MSLFASSETYCRPLFKGAALVICGLMLQGCVARAAVKTTGAAVGTTVKTAGTVAAATAKTTGAVVGGTVGALTYSGNN